MNNEINLINVSENEEKNFGYGIIKKISKKKKIKKILFVIPPDINAENFNLSNAQNYNYYNFLFQYLLYFLYFFFFLYLVKIFF